MDDALLAGRAAAGDLDSFGQLYDRYFHRVYDFCWRVLRDGDAAAAATQDTFAQAVNNLRGMPRGGDFQAWLFTLAHNVAVGRAERAVPAPVPVHEEAFGSFEVPDPAQMADPALAGDDLELPALVWEAATALNPRDYAVLDLHVRQGLEAPAISQVMNVNKANAQTMVSRMKSAATDVIGSYVVARRGAQDCAELQAVLAQFEFPPYTAQVRGAIDAHISGCTVCGSARAALPVPLEIFGALLPVAAPLWLKGDIWRAIASTWGAPVAAGATALAASPYAASAAAGGFGGGDDITMPPEAGGADPWDRKRIMLFAGAVLGLLVFAFAGAALVASALGGDDDGGSAAGTTGTPASRTGTPASRTGTPGVIVETATPDPNPSPTPQPTQTATPAPTQPPLPSPVPIPPTATPPPPEPSRTPEPEPTERPATRPPVQGSPTPCLTQGCPTLDI